MLEEVYNSRISYIKVCVQLLLMQGMALGRWQSFQRNFPFYIRDNNPSRIQGDVSWTLTGIYFSSIQEILVISLLGGQAVERQER